MEVFMQNFKDIHGLFVGTNYHPHDWLKEEWIRDLNRMQEAGFRFIRIGHLCWDSFEPREGEFEFEWMDEVFNLCNERDIHVFLDLPTRPAPSWLHKKYPSIDIVNEDGIRQKPVTRYMEDVGDPHFREYAYRMARKLVERYHNHPALLSFGLCNELGSGYHSYSETARQRFCQWLECKYHTIENLNRAWSTQRWSRKESCFADIEFPVTSRLKGAPERYLDMKRFFSDEILSYQKGLYDVVKSIAPQVPVSCNHWAENPQVGYDYPKNYREITDYPGQGFYPGTNPEMEDGFLGACFCSDYRCGELGKPIWDLEFQTGGFGDYSCPPGAMRMYAYLSYLYHAQVICAWTYRSMLGGEEQYVFGLVDHDGTPGFKWEEFSTISKESRILADQKLFPRIPRSSIAIAYSYECLLASDYAHDYYSVPYREQIMETYKALFHMNLDCNIVDLRNVTNHYDIVIIPGHCLMNDKCKHSIDEMLQNGSTVIMTAFSAKADDHNRVFASAFPGMLTGEFGIVIRGFDRARTHYPSVNAGGLEKAEQDLERNKIHISMNGEILPCPINYHEFMELVTAEPLAEYQNVTSSMTTAVSCNHYGNGKAIYIGIPADEELYCRLLPALLQEKGIAIPQKLPKGIVFRKLSRCHQIYINTNAHCVEIPIKYSAHSVLTGMKYYDKIVLQGYDVEITYSQQ